MRVLGIDPGAAVVGYGMVESGPHPAAPARLLECGVIHQEVVRLIARLGPETVAVEDVFFAKNVRTTVVLGHARGVILLAAEEARLPIVEYAPALVKKTVVGRGEAMKGQVARMVATLLRLKEPPSPSDAADGIAVALTHLLIASSRIPLPRERAINGLHARR